VKQKMHPESSNDSEFLFYAELSCMTVNAEATSNTRCEGVKRETLDGSFACFPVTHNLLVLEIHKTWPWIFELE
jgi:hypothetical protein